VGWGFGKGRRVDYTNVFMGWLVGCFMEKWKVLGKETILDTPWLGVEKHKCDVGGGKVIDDFYVVRRSDYVVLVPIENDEVIFVRQYRHGTRDFVLNLPMGFVDGKEKPENAARRELKEELGYIDGGLEYAGRFLTSPSFRNDSGYVFFVDVASAKKTSVLKDDTEVLEPVRISNAELESMLKGNAIKDGSTLIALSMVRDRLGI
jgi:ADP-ribose pyrophosphatase